MKFKRLMIVSFLVSILLGVFLIYSVVKYNQLNAEYIELTEVVEDREQSLLREYVSNQEDIVLYLESTIEEDISTQELAKALSTNNYVLELNNHINVHSDLKAFHYNLNLYLYDLIQKENEGVNEQSEINDVELIISTISEYHEEFKSYYHDSGNEDLQESIEHAADKVINPFLESDLRPF